MTEQATGKTYEYYEDELVSVLEDALRREHEARAFYMESADKRPWKLESKQMLDWLAGEEAKHAKLITEHLDDIKKRLAWIHYEAGPKKD